MDPLALTPDGIRTAKLVEEVTAEDGTGFKLFATTTTASDGVTFGHKAVKSKQHVYFLYDPQRYPEGLINAELCTAFAEMKVRSICAARFANISRKWSIYVGCRRRQPVQVCSSAAGQQTRRQQQCTRERRRLRVGRLVLAIAQKGSLTIGTVCRPPTVAAHQQ